MPDEQNFLDEILDALGEMSNRLGPHGTAFDRDGGPRDGSSYAADFAECQGDALRQELLSVVVWRCRKALALSEDAALTLSRALRLPPPVFGPTAVVRAAVEAAGLVLWLLDPKVDAELRVRRCIAVRRRDLRQQVGFSHAGLREAAGEQREILQRAIDYAEGELRAFETTVGRMRLRGLNAPNFVSLAGGRLGEAYNWEIFSNVVHGNPHAMDAVWKMFHSGDEVSGAAFMNLVTTAVHAHSLAIWTFVSYLHGGEPKSLRRSLERLYDDVHMSEEVREFFREDNG